MLRLTVAVLLVLLSLRSMATQCGEVSVEASFDSYHSVVLVKNIAYASEGALEVEEPPKVQEYGKASNKKNAKMFSYPIDVNITKSRFIVMHDYKKRLLAGSVVNIVDDYAIPPEFQIGGEYLLFIQKLEEDKNEYIFDLCLSFDISKKYVYVDSRKKKDEHYEKFIAELNDHVSKEESMENM